MRVYQIGPDQCEPETKRDDFDWVVVHYDKADGYCGTGTALAYCEHTKLLYRKDLGHYSCEGPFEDGGLESGDVITASNYLAESPDRENVFAAKEVELYDKVKDLLTVDPIEAKFREITDGLKSGDLDNPNACMMAFLDWCEGEGFDMRWFSKIIDKLPEHLRLSPVAIGIALDTRRLAETAGSSIENIHVSHWNPNAPFLKPAGDATAMDIAVGRSNTPSRTLLYKMLEQPYDYDISLWPDSRVPLPLKNF